MGITTPDQVIDTIYKSISESIINSMQLAQNQATASQNVQISCDEEAVSFMTDQVERCAKELKYQKKKDITLIKKLCRPAIECNATNISIKSALNITNLVNQTANIKTNIENSLDSTIKQSLNSLDSSLLLGGNSDELNIKDITKLVSENISNITQEVYNTITQNQNITLSNYAANNVSISSISNIIGNSIQNIEGMSDIVSRISNDIIQELSSNTDSLTKWVSGIMIAGMAVIAILFLILFLLKRKDTKDFIQLMIPYILFFIGVMIIIAIHMIIKPSYIMTDEYNNKYKKVSRDRLIFWCTFFAIILGTIEIIYYKFIKKKKTGQ